MPLAPCPWYSLSQRKSFLLRIDPAILDAVQRWADDDLRSLNGQIEFLLRQALLNSGRKPEKTSPQPPQSEEAS